MLNGTADLESRSSKKRTFAQTDAGEQGPEVYGKVQKTSDDESILISGSSDDLGEPLTSTKIVLNLMGAEPEASSKEAVSPEPQVPQQPKAPVA